MSNPYRFRIDNKKDPPFYIKLGENDFKIIKNCYDFTALPLCTLVNRYYSRSPSRCSQRVENLSFLGFLHKEFYYESDIYDIERKKSRGDRKGVLVFCRRKGAKLIGLDKEYRSRDQDPVGQKDKFKKKFDVYYMIGKLYKKIPSLLSRREALQVYDLKNFTPLECVVPSSPPYFIHVIGEDTGTSWRTNREGKTTDTIEQRLSYAQSRARNEKHIIIAREHNTRFVRDFVRYIPWDIADEVVCNIIKNPNHYLDEFIAMLKQDPKFAFLTYSTPDGLTKINTSHGTYHIGELFSGSNTLRRKLSSPPPNTLIYTHSNEQLRGIALRKSKFYHAYFARDQKVYRIHYKGTEKKFTEQSHPLFTNK